MRNVFAALVLAAAMVACSHDAKPVVEPDPHPPLPEGTPIGYLIDDASELQLRDDQLTQLKAIDTELAAKIDALEAAQHRPAAASSQAPGAGRHRGGRRGGGRRGGGAGSGSGSAVAAPAASSVAAADANQRSEARASDVRNAIASAFAVLDPVQRALASRVLSQHGVDLDAGRTAPGQPEAAPTEPDADSDDK